MRAYCIVFMVVVAVVAGCRHEKTPPSACTAAMLFSGAPPTPTRIELVEYSLYWGEDGYVHLDGIIRNSSAEPVDECLMHVVLTERTVEHPEGEPDDHSIYVIRAGLVDESGKLVKPREPLRPGQTKEVLTHYPNTGGGNFDLSRAKVQFSREHVRQE